MNELLNAVSNAVTGVSSLLIAYELARLLFKRWKDGIPFRETVVLAASLFFFGGLGRTVLVFLIQDDTLDVVVRLLTALISMLTAILIKLSIDRALRMKTPQQYEELTAEKDRQLESLRYELKLLVKPQHGRQQRN